MHIFNVHGSFLRTESARIQATLRGIHKSVMEHHQSLGTLCEDNTHMLAYTSHLLTSAQHMAEQTDFEHAGELLIKD